MIDYSIKIVLLFSSIDFSADGIRQIVESTVSSPRARQQLITYISQLQLHAYNQSSRRNSVIGETYPQHETILLRVKYSFHLAKQNHFLLVIRL